jgi:hypothetical protein
MVPSLLVKDTLRNILKENKTTLYQEVLQIRDVNPRSDFFHPDPKSQIQGQKMTDPDPQQRI